LEDAKVHIDGYDCGVRYADEYVGKILNILDDAGVLEETAVIVAADHGENLGELNIWGDHQTADEYTNHIPTIVRWPGVTQAGMEIGGLHYHLDLAATIVDLAGQRGGEYIAEAGWQGASLAGAMRSEPSGRDRLYLSQGAWSLQRSARWDDWILIHTIDTGMKDFSEWMLFDLRDDRHETKNVASQNPQLVQQVGSEMSEHFARLSEQCVWGDPFEQVLLEGGPHHAKVNGPDWQPYLKRLKETGRERHADWLASNHNSPRPPALAAY
jgi:choline-sulfatase